MKDLGEGVARSINNAREVVGYSGGGAGISSSSAPADWDWRSPRTGWKWHPELAQPQQIIMPNGA